MRLENLKTPAFLVDLAKVRHNAQQMIDRARKLKVRLRPHVKTHKTVEIARMQTEPGFSGITVSTLAEARFYQRAGFDDITYAFPITGDKLSEAAELAGTLRGFHLLLDHPDTLEALESFGKTHRVRFSVFLKVDCGFHRAGVDPEKEQAMSLARRLAGSPFVDFQGILTHAGHSYHCRNRGEILQVAREERTVMARFAARLSERGIPCRIVSVGSTPTTVHAETWEGVREIRPGNYIFFDKYQADIGTCSLEDCAVTVLGTVAGHYPDRNRLLLNTGALALSKDPGLEDAHGKTFYGAVLGNPRLRVIGLSQEHSLIDSESPISFGSYPIGSRVRIIPNHSCLTAALFPKYHIIEGEEVVDEWEPVRGW